MRKFVLTTKSHSGDDYTYFIEHEAFPTHLQLMEWLKTNANDVDEDEMYEEINTIKELPKKFDKL